MESENKYETFPGWKDNTNDVWERTPDGGKELTNGEVRDRLNALEAERDKLRRALMGLSWLWDDTLDTGVPKAYQEAYQALTKGGGDE